MFDIRQGIVKHSVVHKATKQNPQKATKYYIKTPPPKKKKNTHTKNTHTHKKKQKNKQTNKQTKQTITNKKND